MAVVDELVLRVVVKNESSGSLRDLVTNTRRLGQESQRTGQQGESAFSRMSRAASDFAVSLTKKATSAVIKFGKDSIVKLADFRGEMASVGKTTGLAGDELQHLGDELRDLSIDELRGAVAAEDLAQIAAAAGQLGVKGKDIESFTLDIAEISKATDITADETAEDMAKIANQFRDSLEKPRIYFDEFGNSLGETSKSAFQQISNIGSAINELSNNTTASAATLINMTKRMAGMGASVGLTVDQVAALAATMTDAGLNVEKGSTAMNKMIGELYKNTDSFAMALHLNADDLADTLSKDPMRAIEMVLKGMDQMKQQEGPKALLMAVEDLLGKGDGITQLALNLSSKYADLGKNTIMASKAFHEGTSAHEEFLAQTNHTAARWDALKEKMNEFSRRVGEVFEPLTDTVIGWLHSGADVLLNNFGRWEGEIDVFVQDGKALLSDLVGPDVIASLSSGDFAGAMQSIKTQITEAIAESPFGPIVDAAGLAVGGILREFHIVKDSVLSIFSSLSEEDFSGAFDTFVIGAQLAITNATETFQDLATKTQEFITELTTKFEGTPLAPYVQKIGDVANQTIEIVKGLPDKIGEFIQASKTKLMDLVGPDVIAALSAGDFTGAIDGIRTRISEAIVDSPFAPIVNAAGLAVEGIKSYLTLMKDSTVGVFSSLAEGDYSGAFDSWVSGIRSGVETGNQLLQGLLTHTQEFITGLVAQFEGTPLEPFITEIGDAFNHVIDTVKTLAGWGKELFEVIFTQEHLEFAGNLLLGLGAGLVAAIGTVAAGFNKAYTAVEDFGTLLGDIFSGEVSFEDLIGAIGILASDVGEAFVEVAGNIWEGLTGLTEKFLGWIGEKAGNLVDLLMEPIRTAVKTAEELLEKLSPSNVTKTVSGAVQNEGMTGFFEKYVTNPLMGVKAEDVREVNKEIDTMTTKTADATSALSMFGDVGMYNSVFPDMQEAIQKTIQQENALTDTIQTTTGAVNRLGEDAMYHSVYPDLIRAIQNSESQSDSLTASVQRTTAAANVLGATNPTSSWNTAIDSTISQIGSMSSELSQVSSSVSDFSTSGLDSSLGTSRMYVAGGSGSAEDYEKRKRYQEILNEYKAGRTGLGQSIDDYFGRYGGFAGRIAAKDPDLFELYQKFGTSMPKLHHGGLVDWAQFHSGGLASDEVPAILQKGEYVLSRSDVSNVRKGKTSGVFKKVAATRYHDGGLVSSTSGATAVSGGNTSPIVINVSGKVLDERAFKQFTRDIGRELSRQQRRKVG